jgi:hypothetical protein
MQLALRSHAPTRSRAGLLVALGAAAGALGVAALMSAATAPTARADDSTEILYNLNEELGFGQTAFTASSADFGSGDFSGGLASFFTGVNDDFLSGPQTVLADTLNSLLGEPIAYGATDWNITPEPDFATGLSDAQYFFNIGQGFFSTAASDLSAGDYAGAAFYDGYGFDYSAMVPLEELILGGVSSF